jgi:hypothetical protein
MIKKVQSKPQVAVCIIDRAALAKVVASIYKTTKGAKDAWCRLVKLETTQTELRIQVSGESTRVNLAVLLEDADRCPILKLGVAVDCKLLHLAMRQFSDAAKVELRTEANALLVGRPDWSALQWFFPERLQTGLGTPPHLTDATAHGTVAAQALRFTATSITHARSTDETRDHLCRLQVRATDDGLKLMATDGHRLAGASVSVTWTRIEQPIEACLPASAADLLALLPSNGDVEIFVSEKGIKIQQGSTFELDAASLPDGVFHCEQVIPQHPAENRVKLDSNTLAPLRLACKEAMQTDNAAIQFRFGDFGCQIFPTASGWVKLAGGPLPECNTAFEPRYLLEALENCNLTATIEYGNELDPILIRGDNAKVFEVIMPRRL